MRVPISCSQGERSGQSPSEAQVNDETPRITIVSFVPENEGDRDRPEHESGQNSPRARWWSGQSPSTMVVATVPEHEKCGNSPRAREVWQETICHLYYYLLYLFNYLPYQVQSDMSGQKSRRV